MAQDASASTGTNHVPAQRSGAAEPLPTSTSIPADDRADDRSHDRAVPLHRLMVVAVLTPAQAAHVAAVLLDLDGAPARTVVTASGELRSEPATADEHDRVDDLLEELVRSARRLPAHPRPHQVMLLRRLEEAVGSTELPARVRAAGLRAALLEALGSDAPARVTGELAALVEAFSHVAPGVPAPAAVPAWPAAEPPVRATAPVTRPPRARVDGIGRRRRGRRLALVLLVVAVLLAGGGYLVVRGPGAGLLDSLRGGSTPPPARTPAQHQQPAKHAQQAQRLHPHRAVPSLAPHHAGPVTGVVVQPTGPCRPGALCPVKVTVHLQPAQTTRSISWKVGAARACRHHVAWSTATGVTAQPGWTTVFASSSVRVPKGGHHALLALTTSPARAQSRAVPVAGSSLTC
ncbi:MAG TPA: hypothetical protein VFR99_06515 [Marmoricola sp.]|nr:hypothetical protein [Marmoricola sp.]